LTANLWSTIMAREPEPKTIFLNEYHKPEYLIEDVALTFEIGPEATRVHSRLQVRRAPGVADDRPLVLDGTALQLESVAVDGVPLGSNQYRRDDASLTLFGVAGEAVIEVVTVVYPARNSALEGLYSPAA
jgi:aminopeptidase N